MKTRILLVVAAAAVVATLMSCTREVSVEVTPSEKQMTFIASFEDDGTKTAIQPDGTSVWWTGDESINIFTSSGKSAKFTSAGTEARATAEFTGAFSGSTDGDTFYAVYPYNEANSFSDGKISLTVPSKQTAMEGTFADELYPSVAVSDDDVFRFYHVCGGARLSVSRDDVRQVSIKARGEIPLAGTIRTGFDDSGKPAAVSCTTPSYEVTLTAPGDGCFETGKYYYATLLPGVHSAGLDISFCLSDGRCGTYTAGNPITVHRTLFGKLDKLDQGLEYKKVVEVPEAVDLGLSVKWAPYNVGATKPEEYGDYFAWGETEPKEKYNASTYKWYKNNTYTKYTPGDGKTVLDSEDDAATANWGGLWRTPKRNEWEELNCLCTWTRMTQNGVDGYKVTGPNGNSIFLPAAGLWSGNNDAPGNFTYGYYLSSSAPIAAPGYLWGFWFYSRWHESNHFYRGYGESVRPVYGSPSTTIPVESVSLSTEYTNSVEKVCTTIDYDQTTLYADVYPSYATNCDVTWSSSDPSVATVENGRIIPVSTGRTTVVATTEDGGFQAGIEVIVIYDLWDPSVPVDMGLSVEWSSCNLGWDYYGECPLFAWGETVPKELFSWDNYEYGNDPSALTKYNEEDEMDSLFLEDDAANVILGGNWRIPSADEWRELLENCSWSLAEMYTFTGFIVESPTTGGIIFIPEGVSKDEQYYWPGGYWTSDLSWGETEYALMMEVGWSKNQYGIFDEERYVGHPIRPVYDSGGGPSDPNEIIVFADFKLGALLVNAFDKDGDGYLSYREAASVSEYSLRKVLYNNGNKSYKSFDEFQYFTGIKKLDSGAVSSWYNMSSIVLPESLEIIGPYAFSGCESLTTIRIPESVWELDFQSPFSGCESLTLFEGKFASDDGRLLIIDGRVNSFAPAGLTSYVLPSDITEIDWNVFSGCRNLESITLPNRLKKIGLSSFNGCTKLSSITIPESVESINSMAFMGCPLTSVHIPQNVTYLSDAFCNCSSLASFTGKFTTTDGKMLINDGKLEGIAPYGMTKCIVPEGVTKIASRVFYGCSKIEEIVFPESLELIADFWMTFSGCGAKTITVKALTPPKGIEGMFSTYLETIYVPAESVETYKTAEHWSAYADKIKAIQ